MIEHLATETIKKGLKSKFFKETSIKGATESSPLKSSMETINNTTLENLKIQNEAIHNSAEIDKIQPSEANIPDSAEIKGLSEEEKRQIKNESGWSGDVINAIGTMKEYEIYKEAGLKDVKINGRESLVRSDIDWEQKDSMGRANKGRAEAGLSPINKDGETIELHHIGQKSDGPLAELTRNEHRGMNNYSVLHDTKKQSEINRIDFTKERIEYWKARAAKGGINA